MPIKRRDVITARYLSFLLFDLIGLFFAIATFALTSLTGTILSMERITFIISFGLSLIIMTPALMYPALLQFGANQSEQFTMYALMISIGIVLGSGELTKLLFPGTSDALFRLFLVSLSVVVFIVSYLTSLYLYRRKDLT